MEAFDYTWIFAVGIAFAFFDAFGIGANDVANSFATSVGSRAITLPAACAIAIFTEFGGALLLGGSTTSTIKDGIIKVSLFEGMPQHLMLGFMCSLMGSSLWVITASKFGWPVSTTHSIIGAICGFTVIAAGFDNLNWTTLTKIFLSWIISPGLAGIIASFIFLATKHSVLCHKNSLRRGIFAIPIYFFIALGICTFFVINKAPGGINLAKEGTAENWRKALILTGILSAVYALLCLVFLVPFFKRKLIDEEDMKWYHVFMPWVSKQPHNPNLAKQMAIRAGQKVEEDEILDMKLASKPKSSGLKAALTHGLTVDVVSVRSDRLQKVHDEAEKFDAKTEYLFSFLQVCTAAFASFAHGSNDVANAAGPLAGIYSIYISGDLPDEKSVSVPIWILVLMGFAIDVGLSTFGYNVMRNLGNNITYQSPARGFSMELGTSLTVVTASFLGIPVSTTHCITGATVAVGIVAGNFRAINWKMVSWTIFSWLLTLPVVGLISGLLFLALKGTV